MTKSESQNTDRHNRNKYLPVLLIVVGAAAYFNSLNGPFIYDDSHSITDNQYIRQLWPLWRAMSAPPQSPAAGRPVVSLSLAINYALGALDVRGYHVLNIAVHILCTLILFGIIRRTLLCESLRVPFGRVSGGIALTCAMIWTVHPIQTESVNYITQRTESIMGLFYLLTLYCAIHALNANRRNWWYAASIVSCALGMASKEVMVTAPLMVLLYNLAFTSSSVKQALHKHWRLYAGLAATWLILGALMWSGPRSDSVGASIRVSPLNYAMNQCIVITHYVRLVFWPHPLLLDYGYPEPVTFLEVAPYAMVLCALLIATIAALVRRPQIGFTGAWFFIILGPTSSFVPITSEVGAERRMYLPLAGVIVLIVMTGYVLLEKAANRFREVPETAAAPVVGRFQRRTRAVLIIAVVAALTWVTLGRNEDYRSELAIWQTVVKAAPHGYRGHSTLGAVLESQGNIDEAIEHYRRALKTNPHFFDAHHNLGVALSKQHRMDEAVTHYRRALEIKPDSAPAHFNLGITLASQGELSEAIRHYRRALTIKPDFPEGHYLLGKALAEHGNADEAVVHYRQAVKIKPRFSDAHYSLANTLFTHGRLDESISHYRRVVEIDPDSAEAYHKLGIALGSRGDSEEAIRLYRLALQNKPGFAEAHYNLGAALILAGQLDKALEHFREAVRLRPSWAAPLTGMAWILATHPDPNIRDPKKAVRLAEQAAELAPMPNAVILDTLAAAYAAMGQFHRAVATAEEALALAAANEVVALVELIRGRLNLYQHGKPYREPAQGQGPIAP